MSSTDTDVDEAQVKALRAALDVVELLIARGVPARQAVALTVTALQLGETDLDDVSPPPPRPMPARLYNFERGKKRS